MIFFRTLPGDAKLFTAVDKSWKDIMRRVEDRRNALKAATTTGTLETLTSCRQNLEKIQKSLEVGPGFIDIRQSLAGCQLTYALPTGVLHIDSRPWNCLFKA